MDDLANTAMVDGNDRPPQQRAAAPHRDTNAAAKRVKAPVSNALLGVLVVAGGLIAGLLFTLASFVDGEAAGKLLIRIALVDIPLLPILVVLAFMGTAVVTSNRRSAAAQQRLKSSEAERALAIAAIQDGMWFWDIEADEQTFTPRWMEILGYSKSDIRDGHAVSSIHPDDHDRAAQALHAHLDSKAPYDLEIRLQHKQGYHVWVRSKGQAVWDERGRPIRMAASITEITDRLRAEDALRRSQGQFTAIADNSPSLIYLSDKDSNLLMVNRSYQKFHGITEEFALEQPVTEWLGYRNAELLLEADHKILTTGRPLELEYEIDLADGKKRQMKSVKFPIFDADNNIIGIGGIDDDVTEQKKGEKKLRSAMHAAEGANRAKSEFVANMSHELRTPLNAIIGFSEIMANEFLGPVGSPKYLEYAKDINNSGTHLLAIINNMLDLSKVEAGKFELQENTINVREALEACLTLVKGQAEKREVLVEYSAPDDLPELRADERNLKQIFLNLLTNAIKFTPAGGTVSIDIWCRQDTGYVFRFTDTGIGIAEEDIPMVLTPFGQVESALSRSQQGTGLGLPLTKAFVELHGGSFELRSAEGAGTTVTLRFPAERIVPRKLRDASKIAGGGSAPADADQTNVPAAPAPLMRSKGRGKSSARAGR